MTRTLPSSSISPRASPPGRRDRPPGREGAGERPGESTGGGADHVVQRRGVLGELTPWSRYFCDQRFRAHARRAGWSQSASTADAGLGKIHPAFRLSWHEGASSGCSPWRGSCVAAARSLANLDVARTGSPSRTGASRPVWPDCRAHCWALASAKGVSVIKVSRSIKGAKVTFALPADESAAGCSVVGDFNGWRPGMHQLRRRSNGTWSASVVLPLGTRTRFRYLGNNGHWFSDPDVLEFDGLDSVLAV